MMMTKIFVAVDKPEKAFIGNISDTPWFLSGPFAALWCCDGFVTIYCYHVFREIFDASWTIPFSHPGGFFFNSISARLR